MTRIGRQAPQRLDGDGNLPSRPTASSGDLGWRWVLARSFADPAVAEAFTTAARST